MTEELNLKVLDLLEEFENKLENVAAIPLTGKIMVDREEFLDLIREINISLPEEYQHVKWMKSQKNHIIEDAQENAEVILSNARVQERQVLEEAKMIQNKMLRDAEDKARDLVEEHEIVQLAHRRADEIIKEAERMGEEIKDGAYSYVEEMLTKAAGSLGGMLETIQHNLRELDEYK